MSVAVYIVRHDVTVTYEDSNLLLTSDLMRDRSSQVLRHRWDVAPEPSAAKLYDHIQSGSTWQATFPRGRKSHRNVFRVRSERFRFPSKRRGADFEIGATLEEPATVQNFQLAPPESVNSIRNHGSTRIEYGLSHL